MDKSKSVVLDNGLVRAVFQMVNGAVSERFLVSDGGGRKLIAESARGSTLSACLLAAEEDEGDRLGIVPDYSNNPPEHTPEFFKPLLSVGRPAPIRFLTLYDHKVVQDEKTSEIRLYARSPNGTQVERVVSLRQGNPYFRITNHLELCQPTLLEFFVDQYCFSLGPDPDFTWTPSVKRDPTCVSGDWTFKSPAIIIQKGRSALSLVPDLRSLTGNKVVEKCNLGLDLDITTKPKPVLKYGFIPSMPHYHSSFIHPKGLRAPISTGTLSFSYYLLPFADAKERQAYRKIVSFLWSMFGHDNLIEGNSAQVRPFGAWRKEAWHSLADEVWFDFDYDGEECGAFRCKLFGFKNDAWFCAWWNNLRTAYGLELYSRQSGDNRSSERAHRILNLALKAPRKDGFFPVVYNRDAGQHHWDRDHMFGGYRDLYHNFDMSWTSYWLLRWLKDLVPDDKRILPLCVAYGDFLAQTQHENGFIPSYYDEDLTVKEKFQLEEETKEPKAYVEYLRRINEITGENIRLNKESCEPAACAVFLTELYKVTGKRKYLDAAAKAMRYVEKHIMPDEKWFDYETFLSCSPKSYDFYDPITGQYPQNNMCTIQSAKAFLALYDLTDEKRFLDLGTTVLDYLSLTQQVWSHPLFTPNLIGGFTTQNSDAEWSDARQAYCAILYLDFFERTGNLEYLERGIAALRASFAVSPYENWAHEGYLDKPGVFSGFHWGLGSGMASVETVWERYGDILVDIQNQWAYGVNGCSVDLSLIGDQVQLQVVSDLEWEEPLHIVFWNVPKGRYRLVINSESVGEFESSKLEKGVTWSFKK